MKLVSCAFAFVAMIGVAVPATATQILLTTSSVIGSTGSYDGSRSAVNIFDQQAGPVADQDASGLHYWINQEGGRADAYITVDLGAAYTIGSFDLFNTHNIGYGDRGTGSFSIVGANAIVADAGNGFTLSGPQTVLTTGTLTAAPISDPIAAQTFASSSTTAVRYLQFLPTSEASVNGHCCSNNEYGLAELRVFSGTAVAAVPEPASWSMFIGGFGAIGFGMRRRRRTTVGFAV